MTCEQSWTIDIFAKDFIKTQTDKESERLRTCGVKPIILPVKNMCTFEENLKIINRIEVNTGFDFDKVKQVKFDVLITDYDIG
jgi:hypothetical protein